MDGEDVDDIMLVTGRKSAKKRARKAHDSGDSDEDGDEDSRPSAGSKRGKRAAAGEGFTIEDLSDSERKKLEDMTELDREMYLFEREEQLQRQRQRQAVLDQTRNRDEQVEVRASSRRQRAQAGTDSAIGKIAAAHAQREAREKRKQQEEEERAGKLQRARGRKQVQEEEEQELPEEEEEYSEEDEQSAEEGEQSEGSVGAEMEAEGDEEDREAGAAAGKAVGARAEVFDEGAGYEEAEEAASLEEIQSIQLTRSKLEAWHNEPFFETDLPGCVLRIVPNLGPNAPRTSQPQYMLVRVEGVVQRNSYAFPKPPERTRKWLHLDDLSGQVFRHQMNMVSNSLITPQEYEKAKTRAARTGAKFITKGDVQQALEKLQHARSFKYDSALVKQMLQKKRAQGKVVGGFTQTRARLTHEIILAQQEGRPDDEIQRLRDELDRLEQQHRARMEEEEEMLAAAVQAEKGGAAGAAVLGSRVKPSMALALVNIRNRDRNAFKTLNAPPGSAIATAAAASLGAANTADVFSRRHTVSKVYWATKKRGDGGDEAQQQQEQQQLQRTSSGAADVEMLKGSLKRMDPSELIKVLDLNIDLSALPKQQQELLPKRVLGPRWYQTTDKRQQKVCAGRRLISLDEWRQRTSDQREGM